MIDVIFKLAGGKTKIKPTADTVKKVKNAPELTPHQKNLIETGRFYTSNKNTFWDKLWNISKKHPWAAAGTAGALVTAPLVMRKLLSD